MIAMYTPFIKTPPIRLLALASLLPLGSPTFLHAQTADDDEDADLVFTLNPFVVTAEKDSGYLSTNSVSGTSLNMAIRDLPMPLEVINADMIEDLQASNLKEALSYSAGVFVQSYQNTSGANTGGSQEASPSSSASVNNPFTNTISIRGYVVPNQQRMGFRVGSIIPKYGVVLGGLTDTVNVERQEVVRGPAALLYGINVLSGIVNIIPKRPLAEVHTSMNLGYGSDGYRRATLDHTGPIVKGLNYRVATSYTEEGDWTDFANTKQKYIVGQVEWIPSSKIQVFVEAQYGSSVTSGYGAHYYQDNLAGANNSVDLRNPYNEPYQWGRDFFDEGDYLVEKEGETYTFEDHGPGYRVSGPDTEYTREELNLLGLVTLRPVENLSVELGAYYTTVDEDEFQVALLPFTNSSGPIQPNGRDRQGFGNNPEYDPNDELGYGVGEVFQLPNYRTANPDDTVTDRKFAGYAWYDTPTSADTLQLRARIAYVLEADLFGVPTRHTFAGGYQFIEDRIEFVNGTVDIDSTYSRAIMRDGGLEASDPFIFRSSPLDLTPIRYNGEALGIPGTATYSGLSGITGSDYIVRSGWYDATLRYRGLYGLYQGQYFNDRLTTIFGLRQDSYSAKEREYLRPVDRMRQTNLWQGWSNPVLPYLIGDGSEPYTPIADLPDSLNDSIAASMEKYRANHPGGTLNWDFDKPQRFTTKTGGLSLRVVDPLSVYMLYSEGVFPNTGQRDGAYRSISAETTTNTEIGIKFDLWDAKVSGTISVYRMTRENAVWYWKHAPAPSGWYGAPYGGEVETNTAFSPQALREGRADIVYGVAQQYVEQAFAEAGVGTPANQSQAESYGVNVITQRLNGNELNPTETYIYWFTQYNALTEDNPMRRAFDLAMEDKASLGTPIMWTSRFGAGEGHNPSGNSAITSGGGGYLTFDEETIGVDGQVIISPTKNYQIVLSFSKQDRQVTAFNLAPGYALDRPAGEEMLTTEYDIWVYYLGVENFADPKDPTTYNSASVKGMDLSFVPQYSGRIWNKYRFAEGPLDGLEIGGGVRYDGPAATSVPIGGQELKENRYATPPTKERYVADAFVSYGWRWFDADWRLSLKVDNLFDDHVDQNIADYGLDADGDPIQRRTVNYYDPREYRLNLSIDF